MDSNCIFCKIIAGQLPGKIIDRNNQVIVFMSLQNHPLVVPIKHIENIYSLDDQTAADLMQEVVKIAKVVKSELQADGINIIQNNEPAGGQDVMHLHIHIKPRYKNDGLTDQILNNDSAIKSAFEKLKHALS